MNDKNLFGFIVLWIFMLLVGLMTKGLIGLFVAFILGILIAGISDMYNNGK